MNVNLVSTKNSNTTLLLFLVLFLTQAIKPQSVMSLDGLYISYNIDPFNTVTPDIQMVHINRSLDSCTFLGYKSEVIRQFAIVPVDSSRMISTDQQINLKWQEPYMYLSIGSPQEKEDEGLSLSYLRLNKLPLAWEEINPILHSHLEVIYGYYFYKYPLPYSNSYTLMPITSIEDRAIHYHLKVGKIRTLVFEPE